jgi:Colicin E5 ribonuclease domain
MSDPAGHAGAPQPNEKSMREAQRQKLEKAAERWLQKAENAYREHLMYGRNDYVGGSGVLTNFGLPDDRAAQIRQEVSAYKAAMNGSVVPSSGPEDLIPTRLGPKVAASILFGVAAKDAAKAIATKFGTKIENQITKRGWDKVDVLNAISDPARKIATKDTRFLPGGKRMSDPATAYYSRNGGYVVRNDVNGDIVQISNRNNPNWSAPWD